MRSRTTASSSRVLLALAALAAAACASAPARVAAPAAPSAPAPVAVASHRRATAPAATNGHLRAGIVSVRVTGQDWNWRAPWEKQAPWTRTVTGLVVPGPRILVASTAFGNHLLVEAQKLGSDARTVARVELVDQEGPLALVAVDDPTFWEGLLPCRSRSAPRPRGTSPSSAGSAPGSSTPTRAPCARCVPGGTASRRRAS